MGLTPAGDEVVRVEKVVAALDPLVDAPDSRTVPLPVVVVVVAVLKKVLVALNSLCIEARAPLNAEVEGPSEVVTPVKASFVGATMVLGLNELLKVNGGDESGMALRATRWFLERREGGKSRGSSVVMTPRQGQRPTCKKGKGRRSMRQDTE